MMARVTTPLPPDQWPPGAASVLSVVGAGASQVARRLPPPPVLTAEDLAILAEKQRQAATAWADLAWWKRYRWSICARRKGVPTMPPAGAVGWSGYTLYLACWRDQNTQPGRQPISPCSRRLTDPNASPFDWTP